MKRLFSILLVFVMIAGACGVSASAVSDVESAVPYYANAQSASVTAELDSEGILTVRPYCFALFGTTIIESTTYLEFQTGWTWTRISNGQPNNQWEDSTTALIFSETYTYNLQMSGTFRATTIFDVTRNGKTETITVHSEEFSYSPN